MASLRDEDGIVIFVDYVNGFVGFGDCVVFVDFVNVMEVRWFVHRLFSFAEGASICPHFLRFSTKNHLQTYV